MYTRYEAFLSSLRTVKNSLSNENKQFIISDIFNISLINSILLKLCYRLNLRTSRSNPPFFPYRANSQTWLDLLPNIFHFVSKTAKRNILWFFSAISNPFLRYAVWPISWICVIIFVKQFYYFFWQERKRSFADEKHVVSVKINTSPPLTYSPILGHYWPTFSQFGSALTYHLPSISIASLYPWPPLAASNPYTSQPFHLTPPKPATPPPQPSYYSHYTTSHHYFNKSAF